MSDTVIGKLSRAAWMDSPETLKLMMALCGGPKDKGDEARFVGGCVRDVVLNRGVFDIDIATSHKPEEVMARLQAAKIKAVPTGIEHGTVTAVIEGAGYEITTLRRDVETDGRHAVVAFTDDWQEDARRRDFTMNALYCNIKGELYDYFGGLEDAQNGIVRFIDDPAARIAEDVLRVLRFYRFHAHYGTAAPLDDARAACKAAATDLTTLSAERVRIEILKLLQADQAAQIWEIMIEDGILDVILKPARHTKALARLVVLERELEGKAYAIRRLGVLIGFDQQAAKAVAETLKLSNAEREVLRRICDDQTRLSFDSPAPEVRRQIYRHGVEDVLNRLLVSAAADDITADRLKPAYDLAIKTRLPVFPIRGEDLIGRGLKPGPRFGEILREVEGWWLDQDFAPGRTACLERLDQILAG